MALHFMLFVERKDGLVLVRQSASILHIWNMQY
jgi:hypothetical protein